MTLKYSGANALSYIFSKLQGYFAAKEDVPEVDSTLDTSSSNAIQNGVVATALGAKAPTASPTFTGTVTVPEPASSSNTTEAATTAFVNSRITAALANVSGLSYTVVSTLPASGETGVIYLVPASGGVAPDIYDEYIWTGSAFEMIGNTRMDLSGYLTSSDLVEFTDLEIDTIWENAGE